MTASSGIAALGTTLTWNSNAVPELDNIEMTGSRGERIDITNHDSDDSYREYVLGLLDGGSINFSGNFLPATANQAALWTDHYSRTARTWVITFPDTGTATFTGSGVVESIQVSAPVGGKLSVSGSIAISGKPTFAA